MLLSRYISLAHSVSIETTGGNHAQFFYSTHT
nr:MAG TPA: hypothetical protein [Caudoviricetes sp.]